MLMKYWLIKTEPEEWSWQQQVKSGNKGAEWSGVRNFQAAKNLREMKIGDKCFFYHTGKKNTIDVPSGGSFASPLYSAPFAITPVTIAPGDTAGFYVGGSSNVSYATATISGPVGSVVASNAYLAVTSGHGGLHGSGSFSPRSPLVQLHYGTTPGLSLHRPSYRSNS